MTIQKGTMVRSIEWKNYIEITYRLPVYIILDNDDSYFARIPKIQTKKRISSVYIQGNRTFTAAFVTVLVFLWCVFVQCSSPLTSCFLPWQSESLAEGVAAWDGSLPWGTPTFSPLISLGLNTCSSYHSGFHVVASSTILLVFFLRRHLSVVLFALPADRIWIFITWTNILFLRSTLSCSYTWAPNNQLYQTSCWMLYSDQLGRDG